MEKRPARVILVNPPHSLEERYGSMKAVGNTMPSLGLLGLAGFLRGRGFTVGLIDSPARGLSFDATVREALAFSPDIAGLAAYTPSVHNAARTAGMLKEARPTLPVILGGPHVSAVPALTLSMFPDFDAAAVGESEGHLESLIRTILDGGSLSGIPGTAFRRDGEVVVTARAPELRDLDSLPFPAWDLLPGFPAAYRPAAHTYRRLPSATMFTSRGCPEHCAFCDRSVFGNRVRAFSAEYVVDQMEVLVRRFGIRDLTIYDDIFPLLKPRLIRICEMMRSRGLNLTWSCNSRVNFADRRTLKVMKEAGCYQIGYGIESGDQAILDRITKGFRLEEAEEAIRMTDEAGIKAKGFFITGHPGETLATIRKTVDFAKRLALSDYQTCFFTPYPGTADPKALEKEGKVEVDWPLMNLLQPAFIPAGLSRSDLVYWAARSYREFYLRPRIIWRYVSNIRRPEHLVQIARGARALAQSVARSWLVRLPGRGG